MGGSTHKVFSSFYTHAKLHYTSHYMKHLRLNHETLQKTFCEIRVLKISKRNAKYLMQSYCQCCPYIETNQLICTANQLTGFYVRATLAFNGLNSRQNSCKMSVKGFIFSFVSLFSFVTKIYISLFTIILQKDCLGFESTLIVEEKVMDKKSIRCNIYINDLRNLKELSIFCKKIFFRLPWYLKFMPPVDRKQTVF